MTNTCQDIINTTQRVFQGMTNSVAKEHFDTAHREIVSRCHLSSDVESMTNIVNGISLYSITNSVMRVYECRWQNSANVNDFVGLKETTRESIAQDDRDYLKRSSRVPTHFCVDGESIDLFPTPTVNSTNGYPRIIMRVDRAATLNTADPLPGAVPDHDAWKFGVLKRYAEEIGDPKAPGFKKSFDDALSRLQAHRFTKSAYIAGPQIRPKPFFANPRVR